MFLVVVAHIIVFSLYQPEVMNDTRPTNILIVSGGRGEGEGEGGRGVDEGGRMEGSIIGI